MSTDRATVDVMEARLLAWAAWVKGGRLADGYPVKNVLHPSWMPPAAGQPAGMQTAPPSSDAQQRATHRDVQALSVTLQDTIVVVYLERASPLEQARRLQCQASTVRARVASAKRLLMTMASNRHAQGRQAA